MAGQCGWVECRGLVGGSTYHEHGGGNMWGGWTCGCGQAMWMWPGMCGRGQDVRHCHCEAVLSWLLMRGSVTL